MEHKELCARAREAMAYAYAPYSGYSVGAALLTARGNVYTGCNVENAAYSPTMCAERTAIFKAISEGEHDFVAIAVAGGRDGRCVGAFPPCGVCRQVMAEFCTKDFTVLIATGEDSYDAYTLQDLLPNSFTKEYM